MNALKVSGDTNTFFKKKCPEWQEKSIFLFHLMQFFYITVRSTGRLISQMLPRIRLRSPRNMHFPSVRGAVRATRVRLG